MTRLSTPKPDPDAEFDLAQAFRVLGAAPSYRQLDWVADALREVGIEPEYGDQLVELAEANGSSYFVALDLSTAYHFGAESLTRGPRA